MKDFLIGVGIGFAVGAIMCKTCKPVADVVQKGKKMVEEKVSESKEAIQDKLTDLKPSNKKQKN